MAELSDPIAPFCTSHSPLPPVLPLLTAQTDLLYNIPKAPVLIAQEEICSTPSAVRRLHISRRKTPYPKPTPYTTRFSLPPEDPETELSDGEVHKIRKPAGEAGRPGRGGYNLETVLDWSPDFYLRMRVGVLSKFVGHI
jgi:hypothetical protein